MKSLNKMFLISIVVDALPEHYLKLNIILSSLLHFGKHEKANIIVQLTNKVPLKIVKRVELNGFQTRIIEPFLDQKYCNKLVQLDHFNHENLEGVTGVFLLDIDLAILAPLNVSDTNTITGKIVDYPNPPLTTLQRIFNYAQLRHPDIVKVDCLEAETFNTNFNGGFYYIPKKHIEIFSTEWKKYGKLLYSNRQLFDKPESTTHIDQIAFSMAISSLQLNSHQMNTNWNYPLHLNTTPRYFISSEEIKVLHYHGLLDKNGHILDPRFSNSNVSKIIDSFNLEINKYALF